MLSVIATLPLLASSILLWRSTHASDPSPCSVPWTHWEGFCYKMQPDPLPYQEAQARCILTGGGLVTISSRRQLHFLSRFAEAELKAVGNLWLGCKRERDQEPWFCVDGKPLYDAWGKYEPRVNTTSPATIVLDAGEATTFDSSPTDIHYFVCQKLIVPGSSTRSVSLRFHRIFTDFILKGYTILATPQPESRPGCSALCLETAECVSFNLRENGQCELNTRDLRYHGDGVFERELGSQYFEPIYHT